MSLITDLLSKIKQTGHPKNVPPGLTNSINAYKKKETNRRRAVFISVVATASLISGFAAIYGVKRLTAPAIVVRAAPEARVEETAAGVTAFQDAGKQAEAPLPNAVKSPVSKQTARAGRKKGNDGDMKTAHKKARAAGPVVTAALERPAAAVEGQGGTGTQAAYQHYYSALDYEKEGNILKAAASYAEALRSEPGNYRLTNKIASLYIAMGMWEDASKYLEASVEAKGDYVPALINSGIVSAESGDLKEAEGYFLKALAIEPLNRTALFNIALLHEKQEMPSEARGYYGKLKQLGDPRGVKGLERIEGRAPGTELR